MEGKYDVTLGNQVMGYVLVRRQGLYWSFDCYCRLCGDVMYDLVVIADTSSERLGLLSPQNGCFCLSAKLPVKRLGQGIPRFALYPRHADIKGQILWVDPDEPFRYLHRLEDAYLVTERGKTGIVLHEKKYCQKE